MKIQQYINGKWTAITRKQLENLPDGIYADDIAINDMVMLGWDEIELFLHP